MRADFFSPPVIRHSSLESTTSRRFFPAALFFFGLFVAFGGFDIDRALRQIGQRFIGFFFFIESLLKLIGVLFFAEQLGVSDAATVSGDFIMLDALRASDKSGIENFRL